MSAIYLDHSSAVSDGPIAFASKQEVEIVHTGTQVLTEKDSPDVRLFSRLCGVALFLEPRDPPFYSVPYLEVFAADGQGGWFAQTMEAGNGPIYHITPDYTVRLIAENCQEWYRVMLSDPDWRRERLPGNWPRLPEESENRKNFAEKLNLPSHISKQIRTHYEPPRLFASREDAEKVFPVLDIWTVLREKRTPRFQVHPMMSPQDREGRASVHYRAWLETYSGLMPDEILAGHTLEHCRKLANDHRCANSGNTFVALDRENGDQVAGFAVLSFHARDFVSVPDAGEIAALYVLRDFQGLGIGKDLLDHCLARLPRDWAVLFVLKGNDNAIGFYQHMGFRFTGHEITQNGLTELEMVLKLSEDQ